MTIKTKLTINAVVTAIGIIIIAGFSLSGMKFVQDELHVLTEKSTPYQLKTIALQRSLQEHIANLLKLTTAANEIEFGQIREEAMRSLGEMRKVSEELVALKGGGGNEQKLQVLEKITSDIMATVGDRIKANVAGKAVDATMEQKLVRIDAQLQKISTTMKGTQKRTVGELSSSNDSVKRASAKNTLTQAVVNALTDMKNAVLEVASADQKSTLDSAVAKVNISVHAATKSMFMRTEKNSPLGKEITAVSSDISKLVAAGGGIIEPKQAAMRGEDGAGSRLNHAVDEVNQRISHLNTRMNEYASKINESAREEGKKFDKSLESSVMLSEHLAANSDLFIECSEIRGRIKKIFDVRTADDLNKLKQDITVHFSKANSLLTTKLKGVEGSASITAALNDIRALLLAEGGLADKQLKILQVNLQLQELNDKLKSFVIEQRKEGEAGMSTARAEQENAVKSVNRVFRSNILGVAAIGLAVFFISIGFSIFMGNSISKPIRDMVNMLQDIAGGEGDLTRRLDTGRKDEFGELSCGFNHFVDNIHAIISQVAGNTGQVSAAASHLQSTAEQIATAADKLACHSVTVATASEEMSATSNDISNNCSLASEISNRANATATGGTNVVQETLERMKKIAERVKESAKTVASLGARSDEIGAIVGTIKDIADQTNLLALNAAIEAARAGDQGRGFAVVADEVRALADRTTNATNEISEMIKSIQAETAGAVKSMEHGVRDVEMGMESSRKSGEALQHIVDTINEVNSQVLQIATSAEAQTSVTGEMSINIHQITNEVQETSHGAHKTATAASQLSSLATDLQSMVKRFKL